MGSQKHNKHDSGGQSARAHRHPGSGAPGRQGSEVERSPKRRHERTATGPSGSERDHGRSKVAHEGRVHRQGTG
ncbi:hypothetical protein GA0074696_4041 [Micromonospora purpureochromogenes]|uniref:Uncharacterized protein n=1 Tax=Micromonospora purpureochromogenes TaxID=47872 RepID=A0A1C4Z505_9ACTN|nr:hypothetical protein [Micromonospora purpureochromogenes]SCF28058.1 hypothetical protein GA0074696_4041 [Micromonospora purpureochromogenes]